MHKSVASDEGMSAGHREPRSSLGPITGSLLGSKDEQHPLADQGSLISRHEISPGTMDTYCVTLIPGFPRLLFQRTLETESGQKGLRKPHEQRRAPRLPGNSPGRCRPRAHFSPEQRSGMVVGGNHHGHISSPSCIPQHRKSPPKLRGFTHSDITGWEFVFTDAQMGELPPQLKPFGKFKPKQLFSPQCTHMPTSSQGVWLQREVSLEETVLEKCKDLSPWEQCTGILRHRTVPPTRKMCWSPASRIAQYDPAWEEGS